MRAAWEHLELAAANWWWLAPASGASLAAAGLFIGQDGSASPLAIVLLVLGVATAVLEARSKIAVRDATTTRAADSKVLLHNCLAPLAASVAQMTRRSTAAGREKSLQDVLWCVLTCALGLTEASGSRASVFRRVERRGRDCFEPHPTLNSGRGDAPTSVFYRDDAGEGREVWKVAVTNREPSFHEDIDAKPPPGLDTARSRSYRTFITVPIVVRDNRVIGLLTINAKAPGQLTSDDVGVMQVLASLCGAAFNLCGGQWPEDDAD